VENFRITPSLLALSRLAQALEVPISQLVDGLDAKPKIVKTAFHERSVLLRDEHQSSIRYTSLCRQFADRAMDPFILDVPPGGGRPEAKHHEGEEFLVVLSGKVKMHYAEQEFDLDSGDSLYFDAMIPHRLWNDHSEPAQVLCVFLLR
jgi:mannose-6-phosphate isomerase-like protein (cupin superfamily)